LIEQMIESRVRRFRKDVSSCQEALLRGCWAVFACLALCGCPSSSSKRAKAKGQVKSKSASKVRRVAPGVAAKPMQRSVKRRGFLGMLDGSKLGTGFGSGSASKKGIFRGKADGRPLPWRSGKFSGSGLYGYRSRRTRRSSPKRRVSTSKITQRKEHPALPTTQRSLSLRFAWPAGVRAKLSVLEHNSDAKDKIQLNYRMHLSQHRRGPLIYFDGLARDAYSVRKKAYSLTSYLLPPLQLDSNGKLLRVGSRLGHFQPMLRWFPGAVASRYRRALQNRQLGRLLGRDFYLQIIGLFRGRRFQRGRTLMLVLQGQSLRWLGFVHCYRKKSRRCAHFLLSGPQRSTSTSTVRQRMDIILESRTLLPHLLELRRTVVTRFKKARFARFNGTQKILRRYTFRYR